MASVVPAPVSMYPCLCACIVVIAVVVVATAISQMGDEDVTHLSCVAYILVKRATIKKKTRRHPMHSLSQCTTRFRFA